MEEETPMLCDAVFTFTQPPNCIDGGMVEELEVRVTSSLGIESANEWFYVLKTDQWAIDDPEEVTTLLKRVEAAVKTLIVKNK